MPGNRLGNMKREAARLGLTIADYERRIETEKWCTHCKVWHPRSAFGRDSTRGDGLASSCVASRRVEQRMSTKGRASAFKGRRHTEHTKKLLGEARRGNRNRVGAKHSLESRRRMSETRRRNAKRGPEVHSYKDGKTAERRGVRFSSAYARWRYDVFWRDRFTCQKCGDASGGNLRAHHIRPFADFPELRFEIENGLTLCDTCHKAVHRQGEERGKTNG